jgi:hypothetical protein
MPEFSKEEFDAKTKKHLALLFLGVLFLTFAAHLVSIYCLVHDKASSVEEISKIFNTWIPIITALSSSAATYYFTHEKR